MCVLGQKVQADALSAALNCKQEAAAQLLLEHGADPNLATSRGTTPLMFAASRGSLAMVERLLGREVAEAAATAGEAQPEPEQHLAVGTFVAIHGLVGAAQHNGKSGVVEGFDSGKGRYVVRLGESKRLRVKQRQPGYGGAGRWRRPQRAGGDRRRRYDAAGAEGAGRRAHRGAELQAGGGGARVG